MITENLSTLKIHKLTKEQYERELANGNIDESALYLTPEDEIDLSPYATVEQMNGKADSEHTHTVANITDLTATATELNYMGGVTSNVQIQLDEKASSSHTLSKGIDTTDNKTLTFGETFTVVTDTSVSGHEITDTTTTYTMPSDRTFSTLIPFGTSIPASTDLNTVNYLKVGKYYCDTNVAAKTLKNCPTDQAFMMEVCSPISTTIDNETTGSWVCRLRKITIHCSGVQFIQYCYVESTGGQWIYDSWYVIPRSTFTIDSNDTNGGSAALGSATQPIYVTSDGTLAKCTCTLEKSVPSNAVFTDTITEYITSGARWNTEIGDCATAEGYETVASGSACHAEGIYTEATSSASHAEGYYTVANGRYSHAGGYYTIANNYQYVVGKYNADTTAPTSILDTTTSAGLFIVGIGTDSSARKNGFRVNPAGKVYGTGTFGTSGADYAEYFEWFDGNPNNEDRRGHFVTLEGDKIRYATPNDDYILGVVSADPSVAGDIHSEDWHNRYLKDVFGSKIVEVVEVEETTDEDGKIIPAHTERRWVLNPDYNPDVKYISREERPEWEAIGIVGKLVVVDDGTCQVNGYCQPNTDGIAIASQEKTNYRVMERLDDTHIRIFIR